MSDAIETKLRNLTFIVILGFIISFSLIIGLYFVGGSSNNSNGSSGTSNSGNDSNVEYDVSAMKLVNGEQATSLFDEEGTHILYIGRSTCSVCVSLVPELNEAMKNTDVTINYLPLESTWRTDFGDLFDHLTIETTINSNEGTYGELLEEHGYTPLIIIIKDGKMVDGFVGYRESDTIEELFKKYI